MSNRFLSLWYSPWSLAARWALEHRGIDYRYTEYVPMLGELWLRVQTGRLFGKKASVPALLLDRPTGGEPDALVDSLAIARYAEEHGRGPTLFPDGADAAIEAWNQRAQTLLAAGRILTTRVMAERPGALRESTPKNLRWIPVAATLSRAAARFIARKYPIDQKDSAIEETMRQQLIEYRAALDGREYALGDSLSYADMIGALGLQIVRPAPHRFVPLGPETRACWTQPRLAEEFSDLLAWRDQMLERHYWRRVAG